MSSHLDSEKRAYRIALCTLSSVDRLEIEHELLAESKQSVLQAQMRFDKLGGQSRMDSIVFCLQELDEMDRNNG